MYGNNRTCVICEGDVNGTVFGIKPTLCCTECCSNFPGHRSKYYHKRLVSVSRALSHYHVTAEELKSLNYRTERNPVDTNGRPMRLFLRAEVAFLRDLKIEEIKREAAIQEIVDRVEEQFAIEEKKNRLERKLHVSLGDMDAVLRTYLLGDYLKRSHGCRTTSKDILRRYESLERVRRILAACPRAHPGAVFDFAVEYPEGGVEEYRDLQTRAHRVFREEGDKILEKLSDGDKMKLEGLSLKEAMTQPRLSQPQAMIRWHLCYRGSGSQDYLQIHTTGLGCPRLVLTRGRRIDNPTQARCSSDQL